LLSLLVFNDQVTGVGRIVVGDGIFKNLGVAADTQQKKGQEYREL
jgi:hypothetical protein